MTCGSLVDACGDILGCRASAGFEIEEAIQQGNQTHPLLVTAHKILQETIESLSPTAARKR